MQKYLLLVILVLSNFILTAQKIKDIVSLKNGTSIKGFIIEQVPNEYVKIKVGKNTFVFEENKIDNIEKEKLIYEDSKNPFLLNLGIGTDFSGVGIGIHLFPFNKNLGFGLDIGYIIFISGFTSSVYYRFLPNDTTTKRIIPYLGASYSYYYSPFSRSVGSFAEHVAFRLGFDLKLKNGNYLSFGFNISFLAKISNGDEYEYITGADGYKKRIKVKPVFKSEKLYFLPSISCKINLR